MSPTLTKHLKEQITKMSEQGIVVTIAEILHAVNNWGEFQAGVQTRVPVKDLGKRVTWNDNGIRKTGDLLIAIVSKESPDDPGRIVTAMVRKSSQDCSATKLPGANDIRHA